jgi:hypothetical protein
VTRHLGVPSEASKTICEPMVHSTQTVQISCLKISTISKHKKNEHPLEPRHLGVPSGASKTISERCLSQTVHLPCTNTTTVSKWIETRFHITNVTLEIHQLHPKRFLSLWYVRRKPCTYLVLRLALCPNRPKRASTSASSPRSTIECVQNDFQAGGTFDANRASILRQD